MKIIRKKRKGFTLAEVIACTIILALVSIGTSAVSGHISALKVEARNNVYLSTHNLNVMERLRQMAYDKVETEELHSFYDEDVFSTNSIITKVYVQTSIWENFRIYSVRIDSRIPGSKQKLVNTYTLTDIGGHKRLEESNSGAVDPVGG